MQNFTQEGINAFNGGKKNEAVSLLTQAVQQDPQDENAWLYLGFAIDIPARKRQCFQRVLTINPANAQAISALADLDRPPVDSASTSTASGRIYGTRFSSASTREFANPIQVEGAPPVLALPYVIKTARLRIDQAIKIYTTQDLDAYVQMAQGATLWDSVFIACLAGVIAGAAELFGRLIGFVFGDFLFRSSSILSPFIAAIAAFIGIAGGFAVGIYASSLYLKSLDITPPIAQHSMYYALIFLPFAILGAALSFLVHALGIFAFLIVCLTPILIIVSIFNWWLLKRAMQRAYSLANDKAWITAAIAVFTSYIFASIVQGIVH